MTQSGPVRLGIALTTGMVLHSACSSTSEPPAEVPTDRNDLEAMAVVDLQVKGQPFRVWVAPTPEEQQFGLMHVTTEQMAPLPDGTERGMLFVFSVELELAFWMKDTIIPLDIAYLRSDGTIVKIHTMPALETRTFPSNGLARFALEVNAGRLDALGVFEGDRIEIPESVLKTNR